MIPRFPDKNLLEIKDIIDKEVEKRNLNKSREKWNKDG
jgi:hypothetical protein